MRWSDHKPLALGAYALAAVLALLELAILWQALHPVVPDNYRAYYIDRTTTCLAQPVTGAYALGTEIDFSYGGDETRELRPCGWDGPAGDGMHSIGTSSRLRFAAGTAQPLTLMLELSGVTIGDEGDQRVAISVNGTTIETITVQAGKQARHELAIPASAIGHDGIVDVLLDYPDAINPNGRVSDTHWRAVKLQAASLTPAH